MASRAGPSVFRILLPAKQLPTAVRFYETLLGVRGRKVAEGRFYFDLGPVILGLLDFSRRPARDRAPSSEAIYLATADLEGTFRRARRMGGLASGLLHGDPRQPLGRIVRRPWGERSFYAADPTGNPLCFVDARTKFTGTARQVKAL
ncbi:MAG TPA: VOC family protein, partial [Thermoplasmata archaeon]|nr:VOC family protein [Thermoplasmata archaeon]